MGAGPGGLGGQGMIFPDFSVDLTRFFQGMLLIQFSANEVQDFRNFVLHNCIPILDAEQVYVKPQDLAK